MRSKKGRDFMQITIREPGSAITHFIGMMMAIFAATPLMVKVATTSNHTAFIAMAVFIGSMLSLFGASALYHSITVKDQILKVFRKLDHMMIFVMIAGSYTPVCLIVLHNRIGYILCALVWSIAVLGIILKGCWITCPKWLSSVLYIAMGWLCVLAFVPIFHALPRAGFDWLLAGGIIYTIGGVIYALKVPLFNSRHKNFGSHEIFHIFVMLGSACHFIVMYCFISLRFSMRST